MHAAPLALPRRFLSTSEDRSVSTSITDATNTTILVSTFLVDTATATTTMEVAPIKHINPAAVAAAAPATQAYLEQIREPFREPCAYTTTVKTALFS